LRLTRTALVALLVAVFAAAGCGSSNNSSSSSSGSSTTSGGSGAETPKAADINPMPRDQLKDGGQMVWAVDQFSTQWNYNQLNGTADATNAILQTIMPSMFNADEKANLTVNHDYLTSAELTSKDPEVITYKINPKAKWSNGDPITEKDFAAQWQALNGKNAKFQIASSTGYDRIKSVAAGSDDRTVVVTFAKPFAEWQSLFSYLYPASTNSDPKEFNNGWLNKIPVTAGPFKFGSFDQTAKTVTVVRDPNWWGQPAKLDRFITRALDVDASVNAFVNGEVDYVDVDDASGYKRAQTATNGVIREAAGPDFRHFTFNGTSPVFKDLKVRQAVAMGINRKVIVESDLKGLNFPAVTMDNHFFVNTQTGYQNNSDGIGEYNPDKAKQMLDADGWKMGSGGFRQKDGKTLTVRFVIPSGVPISKQEAELTQAMMQQIGVKLDIQTVPADPFFDKYVAPGNYDITPFSWIGTPFPISPNQSIYQEPFKDKSGQLQIQQNYARVGSKQIDDLMSQAEQELDPAKARQLANEADKLIWQEVHSLTMFQRPQIRGVTKGLANVGAFGFESPIPQNIGYVK
jgi:peptide/nickel transport system substrate-binding protein